MWLLAMSATVRGRIRWPPRKVNDRPPKPVKPEFPDEVKLNIAVTTMEHETIASGSITWSGPELQGRLGKLKNIVKMRLEAVCGQRYAGTEDQNQTVLCH